VSEEWIQCIKHKQITHGYHEEQKYEHKYPYFSVCFQDEEKNHQKWARFVCPCGESKVVRMNWDDKIPQA
jgi:hypothetical protein